MKFHNIVFRAFLMTVLVGINQVSAKKNTVVVENKGSIFSIDFIEGINDFGFGKFLIKADKKFGDDDVKKFTDKAYVQKLNILNNQQRYFIVDIVDVSKPHLFLLYSSLKLDC